jgi:hypothetical protein
MNRIRKLQTSVVLVLLCCTAAWAQQSLNYGFVSPNTREGLKLEDAIRGLQSTEESDLVKRIKRLRCTVRSPISTNRALGSWSDGAEHSILLRVKTDEPTMRYLMSRLGRDANQKAVLYFHTRTKGTARLFIVHPSKRLRAFGKISRLLDEAGISFRTLVPTKQETTVYVVDTENSLAAKVRTVSKKLRARFSSQPGNASFIGDDSVREKGQTVFQQEINGYESKHPRLPPACENN